VVGDEQHLSQSHAVAVAQDAIDLDWRLPHDLPVVTIVKVALAAVLDHRHVRLHDRDLRARERLEERERATIAVALRSWLRDDASNKLPDSLG
jgi:hypothetical protein